MLDMNEEINSTESNGSFNCKKDENPADIKGTNVMKNKADKKTARSGKHPKKIKSKDPQKNETGRSGQFKVEKLIGKTKIDLEKYHDQTLKDVKSEEKACDDLGEKTLNVSGDDPEKLEETEKTVNGNNIKGKEGLLSNVKVDDHKLIEEKERVYGHDKVVETKEETSVEKRKEEKDKSFIDIEKTSTPSGVPQEKQTLKIMKEEPLAPKLPKEQLDHTKETLVCEESEKEKAKETSKKDAAKDYNIEILETEQKTIIQAEKESKQPKDKGKATVLEESIDENRLTKIKMLQQADINEYDKESSENEKIGKDFNWIDSYSSRLPKAMADLKEDFTEILKGLKIEAVKNVPEELEEKLDNRLKSLELCEKMIERLDRIYPKFTEISQKMSAFPELNKNIWEDDAVYKKIKNMEFEKEEIRFKKEIEKIREHNYHILREKVDLVNNYRNTFFGFFLHYFFPIVDGIDSGKKFFMENKDHWIESFPDNKALIIKRAEIYDDLLDLTIDCLKGFSIEEIPVNIGDEFDEEKHDPFMTETDVNLKTNQIKEVNQRGYQFFDPRTNTNHVLRATQVVVVKN